MDRGGERVGKKLPLGASAFAAVVGRGHLQGGGEVALDGQLPILRIADGEAGIDGVDGGGGDGGKSVRQCERVGGGIRDADALCRPA